MAQDKDMNTSASVIPVSELLSQAVISAVDTTHAAKNARVQKENFNKFSNYMEKTKFIVKEFLKVELDGPESLRKALEVLNREIEVAKQLALDCSNRNKIYLFISCRKILKSLEKCTKEISQAISLIPLASLDVPLAIDNKINKLCKNMMAAEYSASAEEEDILEKIELALQERNVERSYANNLLNSIAKAVGISTERPVLIKEFEEFKSEIENAKLRMDLGDAIQMEQIIALLEKADASTSHEAKEKKYIKKRNSLGTQPLEPLQSFYCPITHDVMVDPVETSNGRTFERSAIEKWFADGNKLCPLTLAPLDTSVLRPNRTLRQSIEEWRDRNKMIIIAAIKPQLRSNEEQEVLQSLRQLHKLCLERDLHREWVTMEDYIPILIGLLSAKNREMKILALEILGILASNDDDSKERIGKVDNALKSMVRLLARQGRESKLALQLLLQLSRNSGVRDSIGTVQGCIFLLVTLFSSDDSQVSRDAKELLENLSFNNQNVVQMAKANYFQPLLQLLSSGPENVRKIMAETLSEIQLTDHNKLSLFENGALGPLLQMLSHGDVQMKTLAVKALQNLSNIPQNGLQMIREGALGPLFELLYRYSLSSTTLREQVAAIVMHLAASITSQEAGHEQISLLESEEDIFKLFSLISLTGPDIQKSILKAFCAMCQSSSGSDIREKLRQLSAVQVLVQLCEVNNHTVRSSAVKLFYCLTEDGDDSVFLEHVGQRCIKTFLMIIKTSDDVEEVVASVGIISNLPKDLRLTQWLLDAGALQIILDCLTNKNRNASYRRQTLENAAGALCRFTDPTNQECQKRVAEAGFIPVLVQLLISGTPLAKQNAAISLKHLSESSTALTKPLKRSLFTCCLASPESACAVHSGVCTVESSFCIIKANALEPLVRMLEETDPRSCESSLDTVLTLIEGEMLPRGTKVLDEANAIAPMIKLLSSTSVKVQEKTLRALERIFGLVEFKQKYGTSAQMRLVDITQRGSSYMKSLAAKVLAKLNVLGEQSSYF